MARVGDGRWLFPGAAFAAGVERRNPATSEEGRSAGWEEMDTSSGPDLDERTDTGLAEVHADEEVDAGTLTGEADGIDDSGLNEAVSVLVHGRAASGDRDVRAAA